MNQLSYSNHMTFLTHPPLYNGPELPQVNAVAQELKRLVLHAHSAVQKQSSACIVCGKPHEQKLEEAKYLR